MRATGYPMTWRRFIARNGLADGDYDKAPERHAARVNTTSREPLPAEAFTAVDEADRQATVLRTTQQLSNHRAERVEEQERAMKALAGDLRRLENDAADEKAVCHLIAHRTELDPEIVAAVLKEFFAT